MVHCLAATELFKYSVLFMPPYETQLAYPHAWHNRRNVFLHIFWYKWPILTPALLALLNLTLPLCLYCPGNVVNLYQKSTSPATFC